MKIYKITEASDYLGVSINTLKTLANKALEHMGYADYLKERHRRISNAGVAGSKEQGG